MALTKTEAETERQRSDPDLSRGQDKSQNKEPFSILAKKAKKKKK